MADVLIRGVPEKVLARLKQRAAARGHSLQAELQELLVNGSGAGLQAAVRMAARLRKSLRGRKHTDSGEMQREDRDR
jgi:plasmid stability protein